MPASTIILTVKDDGTATIQRLAGEHKKMREQVVEDASQMSRAWETAKGGLAALGIGFSAAAVVSEIKSMVAAGVEAEHNATQLAFSLENAVGERGFAAYSEAAEIATAETAKYAVVTQSTAEHALQLLITNTGDAVGSMEHLSLVFDLMQQKGKDVDTAVRIISLAMEGNTTALQKQFPEFRNLTEEMGKHATGAERGAFAMQYLTDKLAGARGAMGDMETASAKMLKVLKEIDELGGRAAGAIAKEVSHVKITDLTPLAMEGDYGENEKRDAEESQKHELAAKKVEAAMKIQVEEQLKQIEAQQEVARWLGISLDSLRMMSDAEKGEFVVRQSILDNVDQVNEAEQVRLLEQKQYMAELMAEKDYQDHIEKSLAQQAEATRRKAEAEKVLGDIQKAQQLAQFAGPDVDAATGIHRLRTEGFSAGGKSISEIQDLLSASQAIKAAPGSEDGSDLARLQKDLRESLQTTARAQANHPGAGLSEVPGGDNGPGFKGAKIIGAGPGGGSTINMTVNVNGSLADAGTIASFVRDAVVPHLNNLGDQQGPESPFHSLPR